MESYLRLIALSLGFAVALAIGTWAFSEGGTRFQLVTIGNEIFTLEVASTPEKKARGLRARSSLADNGGMLVQLDNPADLSYSTRYTDFPIDVLYFNADGVVLAVDQVPANERSLTASTSPGPVSGAILLLGGTTKRMALRPGYHINFGRAPQRRANRDGSP